MRAEAPTGRTAEWGLRAWLISQPHKFRERLSKEQRWGCCSLAPGRVSGYAGFAFADYLGADFLNEGFGFGGG